MVLKIIIGLIIFSILFNIFEKVTGIDLTGDNKKETNEEKKEEKKEYTPLELELQELEPGAYNRAKKIAGFIIPLYKQPYVEINEVFKSSIEVLASKFLNNQLLFSEQYENHVILVSGKVQTIGKEDDLVYLSIGDAEYYRIGTGESVRQLIKCYLDKSDMKDDNYKELVLKMRPGEEVTIVGVLKLDTIKRFELHGSTLIEAGKVVPDKIMKIAVDSINEKYETK